MAPNKKIQFPHQSYGYSRRIHPIQGKPDKTAHEMNDLAAKGGNMAADKNIQEFPVPWNYPGKAFSSAGFVFAPCLGKSDFFANS